MAYSFFTYLNDGQISLLVIPKTTNVDTISGAFTAIKYANAIVTMLPLDSSLIAAEAYTTLYNW